MANAPTQSGVDKAPHPQGQTTRRVRVKLDTVTDARKEMSKLYREARAGKIDIADASKLANILMLIGRMIEGSDFERRLEALEAAEHI
ncbi:hypothetical protein [Thalassobius sp. Cn5-15]|uniref:hypothetical protein n=1 Tax=Thalassobius sp. Cn5-15 TaxID=2917763 RepID=UPI001EF22D1C|nr:hypothetical protein [Thalassobius sp. Cn5-15]MCG7493293.1 hypothetical protein [Thalassobius sp. Cn5-15]